MIILKNMDSLTPWAYDFLSHKFLTIFTLLGMHSLFLNWPQIQSGEQLVTLNSSATIPVVDISCLGGQNYGMQSLKLDKAIFFSPSL